MLSFYDSYHLTTERDAMSVSFIYHCDVFYARKLFMLRDSFADAMDDFVASRFQASCMVHYSSYSHQLALQEEADIFVYETVERRVGELLNFRMEL